MKQKYHLSCIHWQYNGGEFQTCVSQDTIFTSTRLSDVKRELKRIRKNAVSAGEEIAVENTLTAYKVKSTRFAHNALICCANDKKRNFWVYTIKYM